MNTNEQNRQPNGLVNETSPYLRQHLYNPVNWLPFSEQVFKIAAEQNKPLIISIGYSACHWCHVMERESFEDEGVATLMNEHFINVKVDREERPDVDMLYMQAVQLMTGRGGWPLNVLVLPDGRPFYGGTYFPRQKWIQALTDISGIYAEEPDKVEAYARRLMEAINHAEQITTTAKEDALPDRFMLRQMTEAWKQRVDNVDGGPAHAPKFALPCNYRFLMRYALLEKDRELLAHVNLTLTKMACGGLYDQLHGAFARYSTDMEWKVPHFEKMLYDNAQMIALYSEAFTHTGNQLYRRIATETIDFVNREWRNAEGLYYSAFDADSEGEEGLYYVWKKEELEELLSEDFELFADCYQVNEKGYWEQGNYILMRNTDRPGIAASAGITLQELEDRMERCLNLLRLRAAGRIKPGLDNKTLVSWNAMMCSALCQAALAFGDNTYKLKALETLNRLCELGRQPNGCFKRLAGHSAPAIDGFLDDQAFVMEAMLDAYLLDKNEDWLHQANALATAVSEHFKNQQSPLLFYTGDYSYRLAARTTETGDNVIASSNSQMALNFFRLGISFDNAQWKNTALEMLKAVLPEMRNYGAGYGNWACLALYVVYPVNEVAIVGNHVDENLHKLWKQGLINTIFAVSNKDSELPLLKNRFKAGEELIYVCRNNTCFSPVNSVEEALQQLA